jgi:hypothetical protein
MLQGDWLRKLAIIAIAASFLGLIVDAPLSIWGEYSRRSHWYREYQEQVEHYEKEAADKIVRECAGIVPSNPALRDCLLKGIAAYQKDDTSKQDLKAQQDMAYWALWMLIVSAVGLVVSVFGLCALLYSLKQTRTAIKDTRELGETQMRAYLNLVETETEALHGILRDDEKASVEFKFTNSGSTPARNAKYIATIEINEHPIKFTGGDLVIPSSDEIAPTNTVHNGQILFGNAESARALTESEILSCFKDSSKRLYMFGIIHYDDVFGNPHKTRFCSYAELTEIRRGINSTTYVGRWMKSPYHSEPD